MRMTGTSTGRFAVLVLCAAMSVWQVPPAGAVDWRGYWQGFEREVLGRQAPKRSGLEAAVASIAVATVPANGAVLAADVSAEGHWTFVNREGQRFTAASVREMAGLKANLAPEIAGGSLAVHLAPAAVFVHAKHLALLPVEARLRAVIGGTSYPLRGVGAGTERRWLAEIAPNLLTPLRSKGAFRETVWQLQRALRASPVRILALDPGGPQTLAQAPRAAKAGAVDVDRIDPGKLIRAIGALRGQTAVITGRVTGDTKLTYRTPTGTERTLDYGALRAAAARGDVNLVVLSSTAPRQPGARNWLWLRVEVDGLADALKGASLGDFLGTLSQDRGTLLVEAKARGTNRVALAVLPIEAGGDVQKPGTLGSVVSELYSEVVGTVVSHAIDADLVSRARQHELDRRLLPGVRSDVQWLFLAALAVGLAGLPVAWRWWGWVWPTEQRGEYASARGYRAAWLIRGVLFVGLFLPLVGLAAAIWLVVRMVGRLFTRQSPSVPQRPS